MPNTRFNFNPHSHIRIFTSLLIFALASPQSGYAQQPQTPQQRILTQEDAKTSAAKPSGPREARPELVLQTGVTAPAYNAIFSPDGRLLASMDFMAGSIKLWELATWRELFVINLGAHAAMTYAINSAFAFNPDGSSLFSISAGTLKQWDTRTGRLLRAADLNQGKDFGAVCFSADARRLATMPEVRSSLAVWDVASGRKLQELKLDNTNGQYLLAVALSPDGRTLAFNNEQETGGVRRDALTMLDAASGRVIQTIKVSERKAPMGATSESSRAIRFSPDGRAVAISFNDMNKDMSRFLSGGQMRALDRVNKIRMWDVSSGREMISLDAGSLSAGTYDPLLNSGARDTFALSNDNRQCAVTIGKMIKLFDPAAGRSLATIIGHTGDVIGVNFSADGNFLATTSLDSTIKIWDVSAAAITGRAELARTLSGIAIPVESAAFSDDGRALAVSGSNTVSLWELNTGASLRTVTRPAVERDLDDLVHPAPSIFSAGGRFIAARSGADEIKLWETRTGREVKSFPLSQRNKVVGSGVSPDGKLVALAEGKPTFSSPPGAANPSGGPASSTQPNAPQSPQNFPQFPPAMIPSAPADSTGNSKKDEKARRKEEKEREKEIKKRQQDVLEQMSRQGKKNQKGQAPILMGGMDPAQMRKITEQMEKAAESGDVGKMMETVSQMMGASPIPGAAAMNQPSVSVKLWDVNAASQPRSLPVPPGLLISPSAISSVFAFNPDGRLIASAGKSRSIKINEAASGRELFTLTPERALAVTSLEWSPDGRLLASSIEETRPGVTIDSIATGDSFSGILNYSIRLWDAASGRELRKLTGHTAATRATAFSPDGRLLASGGADAVVKLWDTVTGRELATLNGHSLGVKAVAFSEDGKLLVSGSEDGSARLWDVNSGEALATLVTLNGGVDWLVVTPDGLFDGTPAAWGQILWRFTPDDIFDVAPVEIFFNDFFYPGLLSDIASGKRPKAARNVEQKDRRQPVLKLLRADAQNATGRTAKVKIEVGEPASANQAAPAGARDVRLFRNGTLVKFWRGDALKGQKQATLEAEIPIVAGENRLLAYAFNHDNVKSSDAMLTVTGDESLRRKGVAYVIACGVNQYANAQYNLKYAVADASSFAEEISAQQSRLRT